MSKKLLSVVAGLSMFALAGAASADEPMQLTSAQMDGITAAGPKCVVCKRHFFKKRYFSEANANAFASAFGSNAFAATETFADTGHGFAIAGSSSFSQSSGYIKKRRVCKVC